ncbi:MAG: transposase [Marinosulfonomonas sp.]|nr:transposase [Marinosulfonomonas sp.]
MISILKGQESDERTADVCRRHGISQATFYKYKSRYGGMEPSDAKKLHALEVENARLKKLLAEQILDNAMLRDVNSKKW